MHLRQELELHHCARPQVVAANPDLKSKLSSFKKAGLDPLRSAGKTGEASPTARVSAAPSAISPRDTRWRERTHTVPIFSFLSLSRVAWRSAGHDQGVQPAARPRGLSCIAHSARLVLKTSGGKLMTHIFWPTGSPPPTGMRRECEGYVPIM